MNVGQAPHEQALIAADIGNSSTRVGLFLDPRAATPLRPARVWLWTSGKLAERDELAELPPEPCRWRVASVCRPAERELRCWISRHRPADLVHTLNRADLPLAVEVDHPDRVGLDRLAAAAAANFLRQGDRPAVVVDAGTAITVDLVAADGAFQGGVILPGFQTAATALAEKTDLLPKVRFAAADGPPPVVGKSTEGAIRSGLFWGAVGAVRETVGKITQQLGQRPELFVTGGDALWLARALDATASYEPDLVLIGIAAAWQASVREKSP